MYVFDINTSFIWSLGKNSEAQEIIDEVAPFYLGIQMINLHVFTWYIYHPEEVIIPRKLSSRGSYRPEEVIVPRKLSSRGSYYLRVLITHCRTWRI